MKKFILYIPVIVIAVFAFSCQENLDEEIPQFLKSETAFSAAASEESIAVPAEDSVAEVLSISWNDPAYTVGLEQSKFEVKIGLRDSNFLNFVTKEFTGVLTGSFLGKEVNRAALKLGAMVAQPVNLDIVVTASHVNNNEPKQSNLIQITVTPYGDLGLMPSTTEVTATQETANEDGLVLSWSKAFNGYEGVKTYQLEYGKTGTDFQSSTIVDVTTFSHTFTQLQLNELAFIYDVEPGESGQIDFRVRATNEFGAIAYSNVVTVTVNTYKEVFLDIPYAIGIIGSATAGGWTTDTDMQIADLTKPNEWTTTLYLATGHVKFRANDKWDVNWGAADFPSGTGTQGGADIPVADAGYYKVDFNYSSGAYTFTPVTTGTYSAISLIGAQTSWGSDIEDLTQDPNNDQIWTGTVALEPGELKFRANHDWGTNWGISVGASATALSGFGVQGGGNMQITEAGTYFVYINIATGEYFFGREDKSASFADGAIGIIGSATAGGWDSDTDLTKDPSNPYRWSGTLTLTAGESKFRANDGWDINWGNTGFPGGVGLPGGSNIPVGDDGEYYITFNSATGEYYFLK